MSKRLESLSFGLPHFGQSLGVGELCLRLLTTSRKFWSRPKLILAPIKDVCAVT
jgi:hypothetical protein